MQIKNLIFLFIAISLCGCPYEEVNLPGDIFGFVQDADTEEPVQGAEVKLFRSNDLTGTDTTGMDGKFLFTKQEESEYSLEVIKDLYETHTEIVDVSPGTTLDLEIELRGKPDPEYSISKLHYGFESTQLSFSISNSGIGILNYEIVPTQEWIRVFPESGELTEDSDLIEVTIQREGLPEKSLKAWITIHSEILDEIQIDSIDVYVNYVMDQDSILYRTVTIGTQLWMAENLNTGIMVEAPDNIPTSDNGIIEKFCYENDPLNCEIYGGLYNWDEMMEYEPSDDALIGTTQGICPAGWHVPTDKEWLTLETYLGGAEIAGEKMKDSTLWQGRVLNITNESGFSALPAGLLGPAANFRYIGQTAVFWCSHKDESRFLWYFSIEHKWTSLFYRNTIPDWEGAMSVRCVKDSP